MNFVMIQLVFGVKLLRIDVNHVPTRRDQLLASGHYVCGEKSRREAGK